MCIYWLYVLWSTVREQSMLSVLLDPVKPLPLSTTLKVSGKQDRMFAWYHNVLAIYTYIIIAHYTVRKQTHHSHKHLSALLWIHLCTSASGSVWKTHVRVTAVFPVHITASTPTNALWCDLTELTMSLRAWNPDKTGKTCSVLSAISASCDKKRIRFICFRIIGRFYLWKTRHFATNKYGNTGSCWVLQHHLGRKSLFIADESSDVAGWIFHLLL